MRRMLITTSVLATCAIAVLGASAGSGVAAPARQQAAYAVVDLTPSVTASGGGFGQALGITPTGSVVGAATTEAGNLEAALWNGSTIVNLGTLGGSSSSAHAGNDRGAIVGESLTTGDLASRAFLWINGDMIDLGTLGGTSSWARGIDRRNVVVGGAERADGSLHAFVWQNGEMLDLGTLGGSSSWADAIGDKGDIVGYAAVAGDIAIHAALWEKGHVRDLGTLGGVSSAARAISSRGDAAGWADRVDGSTHAAIWSGTVARDLGTLGGSFSSANGINRRGQAVGVSTLVDDASSAAFLWDGRRMVTLDSLLPADSGWSIIEAFAIDDRGRIAAEALRDGALHAVLLAPR